jgi:hypothetical protein
MHLDLHTDSPEPGINAASFLTALDAALEILRELDREVSSGRFQWRYTELAIGSGLSVVEGELAEVDFSPAAEDVWSRELEALYFDGLASLDSRAGTPVGFNRRMVEAALRLASVLNDGVTAITTYSPHGGQVAITDRLAANAKEVLGRGFTDLGSIEGRLETISLAGRQTFNVRDELTGHSVVCLLGDRLDDVKAALGRRVLVAGEVTFSKSHEPSEISPVYLIRLLDDQLPPTVEEITGIEPDLSQGQPAGLYVRERFYGGQPR